MLCGAVTIALADALSVDLLRVEAVSLPYVPREPPTCLAALVQVRVSSLPRALVLRATDMDGRRAPCVLCGAVAMALADALSVDTTFISSDSTVCSVAKRAQSVREKREARGYTGYKGYKGYVQSTGVYGVYPEQGGIWGISSPRG